MHTCRKRTGKTKKSLRGRREKKEHERGEKDVTKREAENASSRSSNRKCKIPLKKEKGAFV
jgi:hypothetical protein|tara:strand:- start:262 stop:444 length:183 start_codon:yes stop_codon:yes gene_type:complete